MASLVVGDVELPLDVVDLWALEEVKWSQWSADGSPDVLHYNLYGDTLGQLS